MVSNESVKVSVAAFAARLRKLEAHRREFDRLAGKLTLLEATDIEKYLAAENAVLAGRPGMVPGPHGGPGLSPPQPDAADRTIYQRRCVRPRDMGAPDPNLQAMRDGDRQVLYDVRRIRN